MIYQDDKTQIAEALEIEKGILSLMEDGGRVEIARMLNTTPLDYHKLDRVCGLITRQKNKVKELEKALKGVEK